MKETNSIYLALLLGFCASTNAAPPFNSQSSAQLGLINTTASFAALPNITIPDGSTRISVGPAFPPGLKPPGHGMYYEVPFSDPPVKLKFQYWKLNPDRNETEVGECFQEAIRECSDRAKRSTKMIKRGWESGTIVLGVVPWKQDPDQEQYLTYGTVVDVLLGANSFRLFYPHLNFLFDIYMIVGEQEDEVYVGNGQLDVFILGQHTTETVGSADGLENM